MSVSARYANGPLLTYSLIAYSPYEGWRAAITGTGGRMEMQEFQSGPLAEQSRDRIAVFTRDGEMITHDVPQAAGGHGGGDEKLLERLFGAGAQPDPLEHMAGSRAGAMSILIGVAANRSMATGSPVRIADLLRGASPEPPPAATAG